MDVWNINGLIWINNKIGFIYTFKFGFCMSILFRTTDSIHYVFANDLAHFHQSVVWSSLMNFPHIIVFEHEDFQELMYSGPNVPWNLQYISLNPEMCIFHALYETAISRRHDDHNKPNMIMLNIKHDTKYHNLNVKSNWNMNVFLFSLWICCVSANGSTVKLICICQNGEQTCRWKYLTYGC